MELPIYTNRVISEPHANSQLGILSNEILQKLLMHLPTSDLLSFRLVSNRWRNNASFICRQRHVKLNQKQQKYETELLMCNLENLPWSSYYVEECSEDFQNVCIKLFGSYLLELGIKGTGVEIIKLLQQTPNIRNLEIPFMVASVLKKEIAEKEIVSLLSLRSLKIDLTEDSVSLFDLLLNSAPNLKHVTTTVFITKVETAHKVANILAVSPHLSLDINYFKLMPKILHTLTMQTLPIKKLKLGEFGCENYEIFTPDSIPKLEQLIAKSGSQLEELEYHCVFTDEISELSFQFQTLPLLKYLQLELDCTTLDETFVICFFSTIESKMFPVLEKVRIDVTHLGYIRTALFNDNAEFETVREFKLTYDTDTDIAYASVRDNWSRVFPNLRKLDIKIYEYEEDTLLQQVFFHKHLVHLTIFAFSSYTGNSIFSGVPDPDLVFGQTEAEIFEIRRLHSRPSIHSLKELKILELQGMYGFTDAGISLSLLEIHPLEKLSFEHQDYDVTDECVERLKSYHKHVEIF